jgi:hypothetical protein
MVTEINVSLSSGVNLKLNPIQPDNFFNELIEKFIKPQYQKSNDWNKTLKDALNELDRISVVHNLKRVDLETSFLQAVEGRLAKDLAELTGVDKIEIIFEGLADYVTDIVKVVQSGASQEETRMKVSFLAENLNLFEVSELLIYFAKQKGGKTAK